MRIIKVASKDIFITGTLKAGIRETQIYSNTLDTQSRVYNSNPFICLGFFFFNKLANTEVKQNQNMDSLKTVSKEIITINIKKIR